MRIHKRLIDLHSPAEVVKQITSIRWGRGGGGGGGAYERGNHTALAGLSRSGRQRPGHACPKSGGIPTSAATLV